MKRLIAALSAVVLMLLISAVPAQASTTTPELVSVFTDSGVTPVSTKAAASLVQDVTASTTATGLTPLFAVRCQQLTGTVSAITLLGSVQFRFSQIATWCFDGVSNSNRHSTVQVQCCALQWSYVGIIGSSSQNLYNNYLWRRYRQGKFCHDLNPLPWGSQCLSSKTPYIWQYMYADGSYNQHGAF